MSNLNNQYSGTNNANSYNYNVQNKLESYNNIDSLIDQTPKKIYNQFSLGINSSHLVNNDKENSFIKANHDNYNDMNYMDHYQNNYQIPSNYGYNNNHHNSINPQNSHLGQHQMDHYNNYQYTSYGFYYPQQPYYGYDYVNGHNYPHYLDPQGYNQSYNNYYYNKTPNTGPKIQQNIILQKSENKLTGQANQQAVDEFGNKKDDFQVRNLFQQVVISEFQPNENESQQITSNQGKQNLNSTNSCSSVIQLQKGKSSKSKSSMEQESEQQQPEESAKKSKITPSKRISKKKPKSTKQTPTNQCSSIQDSEETFSYKNSLLQSQFANANIAFNKALNSEQSSDNMILEEEENITKQEKDSQKLVRRDSQNTVNRKAPRISNASSMISSTTTKIVDENNNLNQLNIHQQISQDQINYNYGTFTKSNKLQAEKQKNEEDHYDDNQLEIDDSDDEDRNNMNNNHQLSQQKNRTQLSISKSQQQQQEVDYDQTSSKSDSEKSPTEAKPCNCRNSKCLKRYCDCFAAGLYCQAECKCEECHNKPEYEDERQKAIQKKKKRIKDAFLPVIQNNSHIKGCHCKNSHCQKKYCVCHQNGVLCSSLCQCVECENKIESMKKEQSSIQNYQVQPPASYLQSPYNNNTLQISPIAMQQQMVKDSSQVINNNQFAQQHLQSPYNNNSLQKDNIDVEFPSTIKKDSIGSVSKPYEEDFSTHKKPTKRKALKFNEKQKALSSIFNEISPADNKYLVNKS
ncbi:tesmin TSO1-like CXC domain protein (macronuclear) [Tetrahymena thermophila SB210]|uniref:Tesmin TSO1-like CXC domain protein n=1 Tax=Tetrahymena thermophila (strain SB210) TaxID=312017 RepID=I7MFS2_TETTS|nr:tesmin TSO1-like CXC domain protein [Tetrahymena thermophila SB210]EAR84174.1 tesmin TSO1-like CXC domain protein [Tetrahymena thermophila SB210]|eukprot:XP_001031837.1 tesmin TSO1-like CXC domain protein [Tetrahymena thermophila SB210]